MRQISFLRTHYQGTYRLKAEVDQATNTFPRESSGRFSSNDIYIACQKDGKIFHYGNDILEYYIDSKRKGNNIINAIVENLGDDIIFNIEETDCETLFQFRAKDMERLEPYLKPRTHGACISPFSTKNRPKAVYVIPDEDLSAYKEIIENSSLDNFITIHYVTLDFLKSLATKNNSWDEMKEDMSQKGLKEKEYIHSIGKWDSYTKYLQKSFLKGI